LSIISSNRRSARNPASTVSGSRPEGSEIPNALATVWATSERSCNPDSSTSHTPSGNDRRTWAATRNASRVFPTPPGPVNVSSRAADNNRRTSTNSPRRPTKLLTSAGRLPTPDRITTPTTLPAEHPDHPSTEHPNRGIAVALYPLLKKINTALALGSVVFRTIEAVFYTAAVVSLLSVLTLGQQLATAPADNRAPIHPIADTLLGMRDHSTLAGVFAFSLGALMYYTLFYRSRLVPRWLSGWGMAAALLMMTACLLALFSNSPVTGYTLLILPIAVQEMVLAVWLLVKGFNPSARAEVVVDWATEQA
jgi:hypothetical protein